MRVAHAHSAGCRIDIFAQNASSQWKQQAQPQPAYENKSDALFFYIHLKYRRSRSIQANGHNSFRTHHFDKWNSRVNIPLRRTFALLSHSPSGLVICLPHNLRQS